jgi:hypothetical protein
MDLLPDQLTFLGRTASPHHHHLAPPQWPSPGVRRLPSRRLYRLTVAPAWAAAPGGDLHPCSGRPCTTTSDSGEKHTLTAPSRCSRRAVKLPSGSSISNAVWLASQLNQTEHSSTTAAVSVERMDPMTCGVVSSLPTNPSSQVTQSSRSYASSEAQQPLLLSWALQRVYPRGRQFSCPSTARRCSIRYLLWVRAPR